MADSRAAVASDKARTEFRAADIPDKIYFKISEVCQITGLKPHVLRFWETEFREIHPQKSRTNQRLYRRRDLETIFQIKKLLYEERFTIEGAKKALRALQQEDASKEARDAQIAMPFATEDYRAALRATLDELRAIRTALTDD